MSLYLGAGNILFCVVYLIGDSLAAGLMVVVKTSGTPTLCKTDEVGELCLSAPYCGTGYWGLQGVSNSQFKVSIPVCHRAPVSTCIQLKVRTKTRAEG